MVKRGASVIVRTLRIRGHHECLVMDHATACVLAATVTSRAGSVGDW